jgi:hypothetical protein
VNWERCENAPNRPHNYRREDGWSIYLANSELNLWELCGPDGKEGAGPEFSPDRIDLVLKWADEVIAKVQGQN